MYQFFKFIFLVVLLYINKADAQTLFKLSSYRPHGELGYINKPGISLEGGHIGEFEDRFRKGITASLSFMLPRVPIHRTYELINRNPHEATLKYTFTAIFSINYFYDFALIEKSNYTVFLGLGVGIGGFGTDYTYNSPTVSRSMSEFFMLGQISPRLGFEYPIKDGVKLSFHANRFLMMTYGAGGFSAHEFGLGINYILK